MSYLQRGSGAFVAAVLAAVVMVSVAGCTSVTPSATASSTPAASVDTPQKLSEGDVIKISFPAAPNLETTQQIRRDGRVNLAMIGEVIAVNKTPAELEAELIQQFSSQLVSKEIKVTVVSSSFAVFVTGAVLRPGKIAPVRAVSALEAVMEAGGFDMTKADTARVRVIRNEGNQTKNFTVNLKAVLDGTSAEPFYLKSHDIVFVPEKITWF